jgi:hypothetical protein
MKAPDLRKRKRSELMPIQKGARKGTAAPSLAMIFAQRNGIV